VKDQERAMPLPFDAPLKDILQKFTRDFEEQLGLIGPEPGAASHTGTIVSRSTSDERIECVSSYSR
jgi:hypothetical protein